MKDFWLCFVPLFVAVDAVGVLPMYLGLTVGLDPSKHRRVLYQSVVTAAAVALAFLVAGKALLSLLGITVADFMIAGGIVLFVISVTDLFTTEKTQRRVDVDSLGAVPLGVPLITGPAVLTTTILLLDQYLADLRTGIEGEPMLGPHLERSVIVAAPNDRAFDSRLPRSDARC